jgi:transcriptional regulator with XRE-family HTH domain
MSKLIEPSLIGQTIKQLRLSRHWTQDYLADIVGYSVRNLRRIENDGTGRIDVVNTFAELFGVSAIDILNGVSF